MVALVLLGMMGYVYTVCVMGIGALAPDALVILGALVLVLAVGLVARWVER